MASALENSPAVVVGIDFGTAASGYCYAFADRPETILDGNLAENPRYHKAPSVLWQDPAGRFRAFGLEASEGYAQDLYSDRDNSFFFKNYKLGLVDAKSDPKIIAENGCEQPLLTVVAQTLDYISSKAFDQIEKTLGNHMDPTSFIWVITVPAIWNDFAKHFMRRAAFQAGLVDSEASGRLLLALEPEAAVASCMYDVIPILRLTTGIKFCMVDCGGGTIDITSHQIASGGFEDDQPLCLNEIVPPMGGNWGSVRVDENFLNLLVKPLLGANLFEELCAQPAVKYSLLEEFEIKAKKPHSATSRRAVHLNISSLDHLFDGQYISMGDLVDEYNSKQENEQLRLELTSRALIKIPAALIDIFFDDPIGKILDTLNDLIDLDEMSDLQSMFLVGGFGESKYLQEKLKETFGQRGITITLPPSPGRSVMMGSVRFGLFPKLFATRVSKFTYGVESVVDGRHGVLDKFVTFGQVVPCGLEVERVYIPASPNQEWISVWICSTTDPKASSVLDTSVSKLALLRAKVPSGESAGDRHIKITLSFGSTEVGVCASIVGGGSVKTILDFNAPTETSALAVSSEGIRSVNFLVDVSSSMNDSTSSGRTKLDDTKDGMLYVLDKVLKEENGDCVGMASFSNSFNLVSTEAPLEIGNAQSTIQGLKSTGSTRFFKACLEQLEVIRKTGNALQAERFLLVFTDGDDNQAHNFMADPYFIQLNDLLGRSEGVWDMLAGFIIIAVGLAETGLKPLRVLSQSGRLKLISFEKASDIHAAFVAASEEIMKV